MLDREDLLEALVGLLESATEGAGVELVDKLDALFRDQPRRVVRVTARLRRLRRRLRRLLERPDTPIRQLRERVLAARIDNAASILEALDELEQEDDDDEGEG